MRSTPASMTNEAHFTGETFRFLRSLARNNDREWFRANKSRYEETVRDPAIRFILDFAPHLKNISPNFRADPRGNGGSLFRIYRDTRFSRDKSPFKTHTGIQFRHDQARDAHAPGFYLHLEPEGCFAAVGIWRPDGKTLRKIREGIVEDPAGWEEATGSQAFRSRFELSGDTLVRPPRGFDPEHPLIEVLKRKDYVAVTSISEEEVRRPGFLEEFVAICRAGAPFVGFLCKTLEAPF